MDNLLIQYIGLLKELIKTNNCDDTKINYRDIKNYLKDHENDQDVIETKKILAEYMYRVFEDEKVTEALNSSDEYPFGKIMNICKNDPLRQIQKLNELFQFSIYIPQGSYVQNNMNWFLEDCGLPHSQNLDQLLEFSKNSNLFITKENYGTFEQEKGRYNNVENGYFLDQDYLDFLNNLQVNQMLFAKYYTGNPKVDYLNKKLGNMGELYLFNTLVKEKDTTFVARDLGNGFGYDIYTTAFIEGIKKEILFEVKTTSSLTNDSFQLSENEYKIMQQALKNPKTEYIIAKVYIGLKYVEKDNKLFTEIDENNIAIKYYKAIDEYTFKDLSSDEEYNFTGKATDKDASNKDRTKYVYIKNLEKLKRYV